MDSIAVKATQHKLLLALTINIKTGAPTDISQTVKDREKEKCFSAFITYFFVFQGVSV